MVPPPIIYKLITPGLCFCLSLTTRALFAFLETSITALRLYKLKELARAKDSYEGLLQTLEKDPHKILITTLIISSVADVVTAALATYMMGVIFAYAHLSTGLGFSAGIGFASITIVIFGEIIPKSLAKGEGRGERIFESMLWLIAISYKLLSPLVNILIKISDGMVYNISGAPAFKTTGEWITSEKEIQFLIHYIHDKGLIEPSKTEMLQNIFEIGYTPVKDVMVPATDIVSLDINSSIPQALTIFSTYRFTRLPVYENEQDNIIGMVHLKDIFNVLHNKEVKILKDIVRSIMFIPEAVKVSELLRELRQQQVHIAIVLNEHGSITGLVTLEDVLEEIVGDISDEHEPTSSKIVPITPFEWLVDASINLEEIEEILGIILETEESVTLGGFLTERLQHVPKNGESVFYKEHLFHVKTATAKRVQQVLISKEKGKIT